MSVRADDVVFVGELNPLGSDPRFALYHLPRGRAGDRLRAILGMRDDAYEAVSKANLCEERWSMPAARERAVELAGRYPVVVCLGSKVREAFGLPPGFFRIFRQEVAAGTLGTFVTIPHPSGRNLLWNDPGSHWRARDLLRPLVRGIP